MASYRYFQNKECSYFPCHAKANAENFNCLFCYCPLYALGDKCGGAFTYTDEGIKDCSKCLVPHREENYDLIMEKMPELMALVKKEGSQGNTP